MNNEYSYAEKLALVGEGLMDPKEIGVTTAEEAKELQVLPDAPQRPVFGTTLILRAGVVPMELRAHWAKEESKVLPFDEAAWIEEHKHEFQVQGELHCGNVVGKFGQTFKDPILGLVAIMRQAADRLEQGYTQPETVEHDATEVQPKTSPQEG